MAATQHLLHENIHQRMMLYKILRWTVLSLMVLSLGWGFYLQQEKIIDTFLEYVLIRNGGAYVLEGFKPMIEFELTGKSYAPPRFRHQGPYHVNMTQKMWNFWKDAESHNLKNSKYCFVKRTAFPNKIMSHFFINKEVLVNVLHQHQNVFCQIPGYASPNILVENFSNENSIFWNTVLQDHYLLGILFGYGSENASYFLNFKKLSHSLNPSLAQALIQKHVSLADLPIPSFVYPEFDETMIDYYKNAKSHIQNTYQDQPFIERAKNIFSSKI